MKLSGAKQSGRHETKPHDDRQTSHPPGEAQKRKKKEKALKICAKLMTAAQVQCNIKTLEHSMACLLIAPILHSGSLEGWAQWTRHQIIAGTT